MFKKIMSKQNIDAYYAGTSAKNEEWFRVMRFSPIEQVYSGYRLQNDREVTIHPSLSESTIVDFEKHRPMRVLIKDAVSVLDTARSINRDPSWSLCLEEIADVGERGKKELRDFEFYKNLKISRYRNLSEIFGLRSAPELENASKHTIFFPWESGKYSSDAVMRFEVHEARLDGILSDGLIEMHFLKYKRLMESIRYRGFITSANTALEGFLLQDGGQVHAVITRGLHRFEICRMLGIKWILFKKDKYFSGVVKRSELESWPAVQKRQISLVTADGIFEYFAGKRRI